MLWQAISGILAFLVLIGGAALVLLAKRSDIAREVAIRNVAALTALVATRDIQLADKTRDLETLALEHKQLIQVNSKEMMAAWQQHQQAVYFLENARVRRLCDEYKTRLSQHETV